ncbi:hypothetical protein [Shewanella frigidimarina]|uniref:Uncharacterized protein n=1 Tax=Shewanella frigidimarina TaxID=56812 RepID=A0A106C0J0_SHEFR|nr:hypothetical protein [Shewanella frigidimarina]KVX02026.1 hypothetical protein AWJ07_05500 [Shewanella frigidimarina]
MSFIRAVSSQWSKAEWSHQLVLFWQQDAYVRSLFAGATTMITVANVVAVIKEFPESTKQEQYESNQPLEGLSSIDVTGTLFDCFLLLFVKEIQYKTLSQAEAIIVQLSEYYALEYQKMPICDEKLMNQSVQITKAMNKLKQLRNQQRQAQRNMGSN